MNNQQRLKQLNQYHEGYPLTEQQILDEYKTLYCPAPTPATHPQLFNPMNPPEGWEYDAWHAVWYQLPTDNQVKLQLFIVKISLWATLGLIGWIVFESIRAFYSAT